MLPEGGIYQLLIEVPEPLDLAVGALGPVSLAPGWYVYTGSMVRGLRHRLRRHAAAEKVLRWHIDWLTTAAPVVEVAVWPLTGAADQECATHRALLARPGVTEPVRGFGASDCRCASHLACLGAATEAWPLPDAQLRSPR